MLKSQLLHQTGYCEKDGVQPPSGRVSSATHWRLVGLFVLLLFAFSILAEAKKGKRKMKKRVVIDFQDELLEGNVSNPNIFHLFHKKQIDYGRLVKFRKNFLPEMRRTAREIEP